MLLNFVRNAVNALKFCKKCGEFFPPQLSTFFGLFSVETSTRVGLKCGVAYDHGERHYGTVCS